VTSRAPVSAVPTATSSAVRPKVELVDRYHFRTRAEARTAIFRWIAWYNQRRLHSANDYLPPVEWEHRHTISASTASPMAA
jgi:transposase InsO family protein